MLNIFFDDKLLSLITQVGNPMRIIGGRWNKRWLTLKEFRLFTVI